MLSTTAALAMANARYWSTVAPVVRAELKHWRRRAAAIPDPDLRELALGKLERERFNAEAGAMLATLAPRAHRTDAVRAIVALELLFDLLDGLTERPLQDPIADGERLFSDFIDAVRARPPDAPPLTADDAGYPRELARAASDALGRLPAWEAVSRLAAASAERAAQAQIRMHAVPRIGIGQLEDWARAQTPGTGLEWRELLAGSASSVLAIHALIAAGADPRTATAHADRIDRAYLPICALLTLLDSLVDESRDEAVGRPGYASLYPDRELLSRTLAEMGSRAVDQARALPHGAHHVMILAGVAAYYVSSPEAREEPTSPTLAQVRSELAPLLTLPLAFMRAWRLLRRVR
jgi:tetraprenyl-beta-curcumene synthase